MKKFLTENQKLLLSLFYTNPEKSFFIQEIGRVLGKKPGVFQRTLYSMEKEGLLKSNYQANARFFQANLHHPYYPELKKIVAKTVGVSETIRDMVGGLKDIKMAMIYGSFAKGSERKESDIDLLIVGKSKVEEKLLKEIPRYEKKLQREINFKLYSEKEYCEKKKAEEPFLDEILRDKKIILKGNPDAV